MLDYLSNESKIITEIKRRNIKNVYHFTSLENAVSIVQNGLLSVAVLSARNYSFDKNDELRLDQKLSFISLSITYPNYKMLYKYSKDKTMFFIRLNPSILLRPGNIFFETNAAHSKFKSNKRSNNHEDFSRMFRHNRLDSIPLHYAADFQAEVMSPLYIPSIYIKNFVFANKSDLNLFNQKLNEVNLKHPIKCLVEADLFNYQFGEDIWYPQNENEVDDVFDLL